MKDLLILFIIIIFWIIFGFIAFILNSKNIHRTSFDDEAKAELKFFLWLGLIIFLAAICSILIDKFNNYMDHLLKKINKKE